MHCAHHVFPPIFHPPFLSSWHNRIENSMLRGRYASLAKRMSAKIFVPNTQCEKYPGEAPAHSSTEKKGECVLTCYLHLRNVLGQPVGWFCEPVCGDFQRVAQLSECGAIAEEDARYEKRYESGVDVVCGSPLSLVSRKELRPRETVQDPDGCAIFSCGCPLPMPWSNRPGMRESCSKLLDAPGEWNCINAIAFPVYSCYILYASIFKIYISDIM